MRIRPPRRRRPVAWVAVAVILSGAAAASGSGAAVPRAGLAAGVDHACVAPGSHAPAIAWSTLHNPVLSYPGAGVKDQALVWFAGRWHMIFSYVTGASTAPGHEHWDIATATSPDLAHWSGPRPWSEQPGGSASPDVVRSPDGGFVVTYDSPPDEQGRAQAKLYYRTSADLVHWSGPRRLAPAVHPAPRVRMIDAALAWTGRGLILGYKVGVTSGRQAFEVAWSRSGSLGGPWTVLGRPAISVYGDTFENYELLVVDGRWRLVATSNTLDQPWMFTLEGNPEDASSWLHWSRGEQLAIPAEAWNTGPGISSVGFEHANSVFLCVVPGRAGDVYATYAGSSELTEFGGWGHAAIGVARSTDLVHWTVPPN